MFRSELIPSRRLFTQFAFLAGFASPVAAAPDAHLIDSYGELQLQFEANQGQTDEAVRFLSRGSGYSLYLTVSEAVLVLAKSDLNANRGAGAARLDAPATQSKSVALRMHLIGAEPAPIVGGLDELAGKANYFIGKDPAKWRTYVPTYAKVQYREVYPGIDLVYYGNQRQLEYDFVIAPGTDPDQIILGIEGADKLEIDADGNLVLLVAGGEIRQRKPVIYQEIDGVRHEISGGYTIKDPNRVGFQVADYDSSLPLIIDPVLAYSTYLGGSGDDRGVSIAVDSAGSAYVTGTTGSVTFPATVGAFDTSRNGSLDVFVTKLDPTGSALVYSTFLGGSSFDQGIGIAVDATGAAYVTGSAGSANFPTTTGAFDTTYNGSGDVFVAKLDATGSSLLYSTFLGGSSADGGFGIAVDSADSAYVTGFTLSADHPTTPGAFDTTYGDGGRDAFVTKLNAAGSQLIYSSFLGGTGFDQGRGIAVDATGAAYVTGATGRTAGQNFPTTAGAFATSFTGFQHVFVTKFDAAGSTLVYSTFLGGTSVDEGNSIAVDATGAAYVTGFTDTAAFPTTAGAFDTTAGCCGFMTKLNSTGTALVYSTFLKDAAGFGIAVDSVRNAYVTGDSFGGFPTTPGAFQPTAAGGADAFVAKFNSDGTGLVYSSYLGGSDFDSGLGIAVDAMGAAYMTGVTRASNFPTTTAAVDTSFNGQEDAYIAKLALGAVLLVIDKDSIDDGKAPNFFSGLQVNNDVAAIGARAQLRFFHDQVGQTITLATGQIGGEGWLALKTIPLSWAQAGGVAGYVGDPTANPEDPAPHGTGPGLGAPDANGDPDSLLKSVPNVTPLRATGLNNLIGREVCAVVYDNQVGIDYDQQTGKLKGKNLGTVAFQVSVAEVYSAPALPNVEVRIRDARTVCKGPFALLTDAEAPVEAPPPPQ